MTAPPGGTHPDGAPGGAPSRTAAHPTPPAVPAPAGRWRPLLRAGVELLALCGLAVAQPLLDLYGRSPEQFAFRGVEGRSIVVFAAVVTFAPPLLLLLVEAVVAVVSRRARNALHSALVAGLVAVWVLQALLSVTTGPLRPVAAVVAGVGAAVAHRRLPPVRTWLAFLSPAPVAFLVLFLVASPTSGLVTGQQIAARAGGIGSPAPVVVLVFDELPLASLVTEEGRIDSELFPHFAELAERSSWYRNATSVSSSTGFAVPAIVTGRGVRTGTTPTAADHPDSLFTLLAGRYDLHVTESVTRLCPSNLCDAPPVASGGGRQLLRDAADVFRARLSYSGPVGDAVAGFEEPVEAVEAPVADDGPAEDLFADFELSQPSRVSAFLDGIDGPGADLHYLHLLLPHVPYRFLPSGAQYSPPDPDLGRDGDDWTDQAWLADQGRQRHLLQLGYVDALLGQVLDRLDRTDTFDDALLVVTADHGISFRAGEPIRGLEGQDLDPAVLADLAWVPLFVKVPGQADGTVEDANVTTLDVVPTIADVLDVEVPWELDGRSVLGPERPTAAKSFRPSRVNAFGVDALDPIRVDEVTDLAQVLRQGPDQLLAPGSGRDRWWSLGPAPELLGRDVAEAGAERMLRLVAVELLDPGAYDLAPGSALVPALVRGRVEELAPGDLVLVAVDGVVSATGVVFDDGGPSFSVVVGDDRFREGANEVTVYELT